MSLTRIKGGSGSNPVLTFDRDVWCIGSTATDIPKSGDAFASGLTSPHDKWGSIAPKWVKPEDDRTTYPGRIFVHGVVNAPKADSE